VVKSKKGLQISGQEFSTLKGARKSFQVSELTIFIAFYKHRTGNIIYVSHRIASLNIIENIQ